MRQRVPLIRQLTEILALAIAYYLTAQIGFLLAIPPGHVTAIWPPAGIAVAAVLVLGPRIAPGIWLGSFLANVATAFDPSTMATLVRSLLLPLGIGAGATLQAVAGALLIRRFVGYPNPLHRESEVFKFLAFAGPVSCVISASVGVASLHLAGVVPPVSTAYSWWIWWVGDSIGVLVVTPFVLVWMGEPRAVWRRRQNTVALPLALAFAAIVGVFFGARSELLAPQHGLVAWAILACGLALTALFGAFLLVVTGHAMLFEQLLEERSAELERKHLAEAALRRERSQLQAILDHAPAFISIKDLTGNMVLASRSLFKVLAVPPPEEFIGRNVFDLFPEDVADQLWASDLAALDSDAPIQAEEIVRHQDGSWHTYLTVKFPVRHLDTEAPFGICTIATDITDRKVAEENLRASRAMFQGLFESAPDAIVVAEPVAGCIVRANRQTEVMFGYRIDELLGQNVELLVPERFRERHLKFRVGTMAHPQRRPMGTGLELFGRRKDGSEFPVDITLGTLETEAGPVALSIVRDLSERKQAETERQARLAAEAANRAKSEFVANMSHELRSPMNTILGFARLMANDPELPATAREDLDLILKSGEHLYALVNQVLDLSKLEAGQATLNEADFDLHLLLDDLRSLFAPVAAKKGLQLLFARRRKVPHHVRSDPLKLRQVLINLIDNGIKFTRKGGVSVTVDALPADPSGSVENDLVRLVFMVSDNGPGIAADELPQLFGAFVQAEAGRQQAHGTGLGLTISRGFVRLLGGEMTMDSELGKGTTVRLEIPVRVVGAIAAASETQFRRVLGLAHGQSRYRVLVVDNQAEARELMIRLLAPLGFEVKEAVDGQSAIEAWQRWRPHLVWMDLAMPVLDGIEATRRIRAAPKGRRVVIIAVTASGSEARRNEALSAGCDDLLRKPFREADLFAMMEKYLQVQFIYQEDLPAAPQPLDPHALSRLPEEQRTALENALVRLDADAVEQAIERIRPGNAEIAHALAACAGDFQFESILSALHGGPLGEWSPKGAPPP
jgi:PAS domain S-box-containing protein